MERAISAQYESVKYDENDTHRVIGDTKTHRNRLSVEQQMNLNNIKDTSLYLMDSSESSGDNITSPSSDAKTRNGSPPTDQNHNNRAKKGVFFDTVTVYFFNRSQGFSSIPTQGGSTLGMTRKHFASRKLTLETFENVRKQSRRAVLMKFPMSKARRRRLDFSKSNRFQRHLPYSMASQFNMSDSDADNYPFSDLSDISDSELETENDVFVQPYGVKIRRSLLKASGVDRIDSNEHNDCRSIRNSRGRSGCRCVGECIPEKCECSLLGINCHVDRSSFPCNCISSGCQNPQGRTEFDAQRVKGHLRDTLVKVGLESNVIERQLHTAES